MACLCFGEESIHLGLTSSVACEHVHGAAAQGSGSRVTGSVSETHGSGMTSSSCTYTGGTFETDLEIPTPFALIGLHRHTLLDL